MELEPGYEFARSRVASSNSITVLHVTDPCQQRCSTEIDQPDQLRVV
jgi:hypothetical protein